MYAKYCNVPEEEIDVCPIVGWIADFDDGQAMLDITFNGWFINETGNVNWGQTKVPAINAAAARGRNARRATGPRERAGRRSTNESSKTRPQIPFDWDKQANIEGIGRGGRRRPVGTWRSGTTAGPRWR